MDVYLPGCPPHSDQVFAALAGLLQGQPAALPDKSVCDTCPTVREGKGQVQKLRRFLQAPQYKSDEPLDRMRCLLEQGVLCMGPVTKAGCGGEKRTPRCISVRVPRRTRTMAEPPPAVTTILTQGDFAMFTIDFAKTQVFPNYLDAVRTVGVINTGFIGAVDKSGALNLFDGDIRIMKPDGTHTDFSPADYTDYIGEHVEPYSYGKMPYAKFWNEGFSLDLDAPKGIYRSNCLARINVADKIDTPRAQAELEEFREKFGRPAQATLLYHWARLIEEVYACEHAIDLLKDPEITDPDVRTPAEPKAGRGVGCVEAPRGTLIHDYSTDENGLITRANMIVGATHNLGPINMSVHQAAKTLISGSHVDEGILNRVEMAVRAYDP